MEQQSDSISWPRWRAGLGGGFEGTSKADFDTLVESTGAAELPAYSIQIPTLISYLGLPWEPALNAEQVMAKLNDLFNAAATLLPPEPGAPPNRPPPTELRAALRRHRPNGRALSARQFETLMAPQPASMDLRDETVTVDDHNRWSRVLQLPYNPIRPPREFAEQIEHLRGEAAAAAAEQEAGDQGETPQPGRLTSGALADLLGQPRGRTIANYLGLLRDVIRLPAVQAVLCQECGHPAAHALIELTRLSLDSSFKEKFLAMVRVKRDNRKAENMLTALAAASRAEASPTNWSAISAQLTQLQARLDAVIARTPKNTPKPIVPLGAESLTSVRLRRPNPGIWFLGGR